MSFLQWRLRSALIVSLLAPLALTFAVAGWLTLDAIEAQVEARMQEDVELIARAIRQPLSHALERDRPGSVAQALDSAFRIDRVYGAFVYDADGNRVAATGAGEPEVGRSRLARLAEAGDRRGEFDEYHGEAIFSYFVPLTDSGGRINGLLQLTRQASDIDDALIRLRGLWLIAVVVLVALLAGMLFYGLHRLLGSPLLVLAEAVARVARGERDFRLTPAGPHEVRQLYAGLNAMLDSLNRSEQEVDDRRQAQRRLEGELRRSERLAAIGRLAAGVAHELGSPLAVVDGKAQRALRAETLAPPLRETLEAVRAEVRRMERIVRQLMDFGRANPLRRRATETEVLAQSVLAQLADDIAASGASVALQGERPGPTLEVDGPRLEQALVNLLRNAVQASPGGQVTLGWQATTEAVTFVVEDDGPGIDEAHYGQLFEPFFTTRPVGEGTGLGLAVAHAAVSEHGGRIAVDRAPSGGARFRVWVPRRPPQVAT